MRTASPKIIATDYHRNGICGKGFNVTIFEDTGDDGRRHKFLAVDFGKDADKDTGNVCVAVFDLDLLKQENIEFGVNSFRGDYFSDALRQALEAAREIEAH